MKKYIPKDALLAEIERLREKLKAFDSAAYSEAYIIGAKHTLETISDAIDTLEVKEIDWEKEVNDYFLTINLQDGEQITENTFRNIAKHFIELGLKAKKGE